MSYKKKGPVAEDKDGKLLWNIDKILDKKIENNIEYYFVKWEGWADTDNTWEPI